MGQERKLCDHCHRRTLHDDDICQVCGLNSSAEPGPPSQLEGGNFRSVMINGRAFGLRAPTPKLEGGTEE